MVLVSFSLLKTWRLTSPSASAGVAPEQGKLHPAEIRVTIGMETTLVTSQAADLCSSANSYVVCTKWNSFNRKDEKILPQDRSSSPLVRDLILAAIITVSGLCWGRHLCSKHKNVADAKEFSLISILKNNDFWIWLKSPASHWVRYFFKLLLCLANWKAVIDPVLIITPHIHEKHISYDQFILSLAVVTYKHIIFMFESVCPYGKENHIFVHTEIPSELKRQADKQTEPYKLSWAVKILKNGKFKSQIYTRDNR